MAPTRADLELAVAAYWQTKEDQAAAAAAIQSTAEGKAKAVRGGGHFNPIVNLITRFFLDAGYPLESIGAKGSKTILPGYFRASKSWDLVVIHRGVLVAAVEMKALGGPSFGNNYNNRVEEALGNAVDVSHAHLAKLTGPERPWLGYFLLMDDEEGSRRSVRSRVGEFPLGPEWQQTSYQSRFGISGQRLLDEKLYDAICYVVSSPGDPGPREPTPALDWDHFSAAIQARINYLANLGYP